LFNVGIIKIILETFTHEDFIFLKFVISIFLLFTFFLNLHYFFHFSPTKITKLGNSKPRKHVGEGVTEGAGVI